MGGIAGGMKTYAFVLVAAAVLSLLLTPAVIRWATRRGYLDKPGLRKVHKRAVPRVGGIAIILPTLALLFFVLRINNMVGDAYRAMGAQIAAVILGSTTIFAMGLWDDIRGLRAWTKFAVQIAAAAFVYAMGVHIQVIYLGAFGTLNFGWMSAPVTVLWIVGVTNAVNLIDGLDGLAAGIGAITCAMLAVLAITAHQSVLAVLGLALFGSLVGFLFFNFNPARIFLGDCGSQFLGFIIACFGALASHKSSTLVALALPVLTLGVPLFDTACSFARRLVGGRSPFSPDRGHIHHMLLRKGLNQRNAVLALYGVTLLAALAGVVVIAARNAEAVIWLALFFVGATLLAFFHWSGVIEIRKGLAHFGHSIMAASRARQDRDILGALESELGAFGRNTEVAWAALVRAAEELGFASVALCADGSTDRPLRSWSSPESDAGIGPRLTLPLSDVDSTLRYTVVLTQPATTDWDVALRRLGTLANVLGRCLAASAARQEGVPQLHVVPQPAPAPAQREDVV